MPPSNATNRRSSTYRCVLNIQLSTKFLMQLGSSLIDVAMLRNCQVSLKIRIVA